MQFNRFNSCCVLAAAAKAVHSFSCPSWKSAKVQQINQTRNYTYYTFAAAKGALYLLILLRKRWEETRGSETAVWGHCFLPQCKSALFYSLFHLRSTRKNPRLWGSCRCRGRDDAAFWWLLLHRRGLRPYHAWSLAALPSWWELLVKFSFNLNAFFAEARQHLWPGLARIETFCHMACYYLLPGHAQLPYICPDTHQTPQTRHRRPGSQGMVLLGGLCQQRALHGRAGPWLGCFISFHIVSWCVWMVNWISFWTGLEAGDYARFRDSCTMWQEQTRRIEEREDDGR